MCTPRKAKRARHHGIRPADSRAWRGPGHARRVCDGYDDAEALYTPAWQEAPHGHRPGKRHPPGEGVRAQTPRQHSGKSMIIIGSGVNHWYINNLLYRAPATALLLCAMLREKRRRPEPLRRAGESRRLRALEVDRVRLRLEKPPRLQQAPDLALRAQRPVALRGGLHRLFRGATGRARWAKGHAVDQIAKAVRLGWMPSIPSSTAAPWRSCGRRVRRGRRPTTRSSAGSWGSWRKRSSASRVDDPDAPENFPRVWLIWRANVIFSSGKGHEYFLRHYLGTHSGATADEIAEGSVKSVVVREPAPRGKMDLVVDLNFRMDTSALYSDIVLPAAMWYEKNDLNTTDMHSFFQISARRCLRSGSRRATGTSSSHSRRR